MKRILFDLTVCQPISERKFHGGGVYGYIVFKRMIMLYPSIVAYVNMSYFIDDKVKQLIETHNVKIIDASKVSLVDCVKETKYDIFYSSLYRDEYKDILAYVNKFVLTIHGLRNLEMNRDKTEYYYHNDFKSWIKILIKSTPIYHLLRKKYLDERNWIFSNDNIHIVTVSNHSKNSILYYYPLFDEKKIKVCYSPSTTMENYNQIMPYSCDKYYLIVSCERWIKNAYRAINALDHLFLNPDFKGKAIVVGAIDKTIIKKKIKNKKRFEFLPYVDKDTLESLYKGAYALLYPSLNEGFGYPPLEAMKYGKPVVTSSFSAIYEICSDAVIYTNPYSYEEIGIRLLELNSDIFYKRYSKKALERYSIIEKQQKQDLENLIDFIIE